MDNRNGQATQDHAGAHYPVSSAVKAGGEWGVPKYIGGSTTGGAGLPVHKNHNTLLHSGRFPNSSTMASGDNLVGLASDFLTLVEDSDPPEGSALATLKSTYGASYPAAIVEEMMGLIDELHAKNIPTDQFGALADGLKWTVSEGTIRAVTGVHVRFTRVGPTLVVDVTCMDPEGGVYTLKEMPIILARGPPLWRYWLSLPAGDRTRHLLKRWAPAWDVEHSAAIARLLGKYCDSGSTCSIGDTQHNKIAKKLQPHIPSYGAWPEGLKSWILGLKTPKLLGQALNDLSGLRLTNPLFEGLPHERRGLACDLLMVSAVNMVRGKVWKSLACDPPHLRPLCSSGVLATTVKSSTVPGIKGSKDLLWVLEHAGASWAGAPLMVMSMLPDLTPHDHPDRVYVGVPPKTTFKAPRVLGASGGNRGLFSLLKIPEPAGLYARGDSASPAPTITDSVEESARNEDPGFDACFAGCSSPGRDPKRTIDADADPGSSGEFDTTDGPDHSGLMNPGVAGHPNAPELDLWTDPSPDAAVENVELRQSLAKAEEMIEETSHECTMKTKALAALESRTSKLKRDLAAAVKSSSELEKIRAQDQDRISTLSGQLERSQNKIEELQRNFATIPATAGVTGPSISNLRKAAPLLHQLFLGLMKHQKDSVLPDEVLATIVPLLGARPWGAWTLPPSSNTQIPLLFLYLTTDLTFGRLKKDLLVDVVQCLQNEFTGPTDTSRSLGEDSAEPLDLLGPARPPAAGDTPAQATASGVAGTLPERTTSLRDLSDLCNRLLGVVNDAEGWEESKARLLALSIHMAVCQSMDSLALDFPREKLSEQWNWLVRNRDTERFTRLVQPITDTLAAHDRKNLGGSVPPMAPGMDVDKAAEANKASGWDRREAKKDENKGRTVPSDYSNDYVSVFVNWNWIGQGPQPRQPTAKTTAVHLRSVLGSHAKDAISFIAENHVNYTQGWILVGVDRGLADKVLGLNENVCADRTKCKSSVKRNLREGWVYTYSWAHNQPFRVDLSNRRMTIGTPETILRPTHSTQPDDRRASGGPAGTRGRGSRSPRRGDRRRSSPRSRGLSPSYSPMRSRRGRSYSRSPSRDRRDSRKDSSRRHSGKRRASRSLSRDRKHDNPGRRRSPDRRRDSAPVDGVKLLEAPAVAPPVAPAGNLGKGQAGAGGWYTDTNGIWQWYNAADHQVSQN